MNNYIDEFRDSSAAARLAEILAKYRGKNITLMEVCGTHTMSIARYGIRKLLPPGIRLVSGPGCPVCVTPQSYVDCAVKLAGMDGVIIASFGDMMRVPGSSSSLLKSRASGCDVRLVYSPLDCLKLAEQNPGKKVVFLSVGFETTTPITALAILKAKSEGIKNLLFLAANKTMPQALSLLAADSEAHIDGFLYPGHVSAVTGTGVYDEISQKYRIPGVITGFEPLDILHAVATLSELANRGEARAVNEYSRAVKPEGNPIAREKMYEVFEPADAYWRGLGTVPGSGLAIREKYRELDASVLLGAATPQVSEPAGCRCGEVLKGRISPNQCALFGKLCTPEKPVGACMVSTEGTCAAHYKYGGT